MSPERDALLCSRYPALFAKRKPPVTEYAISQWGFECDDGWFELIDELCARLQAGVAESRFPQLVAVQVKAKFGTLRFYLAEPTPETRVIVADAERRSAVTCEVCGGPGVHRRRRWVKTLCDVHDAM